MPKVADLHIHTNFSDGTLSPVQVVECAKSKGLDAIAITDHDSCLGITPAVQTAKNINLEVVSGVELSAEIDEDNIHILGYLINWREEWFLKELDILTKSRESRARKILQKLRKYDIDLSEKELFQLSGPGSVGRLHIAHLMFKKGYVSSIAVAFSKYISNSGPCYVKNFKLSPKDAVGMINRLDGISVLAHPKTVNTKNRCIEDIIKGLISNGLNGIEVYHSDHTAGDEKRFRKLAEKYNLLITGGSDCHGLGKKDILIGRIKMPYEYVEKLKSFKYGEA